MQGTRNSLQRNGIAPWALGALATLALTACSAAEYSTDGKQSSAAASVDDSADAIANTGGGGSSEDATAANPGATDAGQTDAADAGKDKGGTDKATDKGGDKGGDKGADKGGDKGGTDASDGGAGADDGDAVDPNSPEALKAACAGAKKKSLTQHVDFPNPARQCDWNRDDNLGKIDRKVQARREQSVALNLPANAVLCSLEITAADQPMRYDDQILLSLNDVILWTSHAFSPHLPKRDGFLVYDWTSIRGTDFDPQGSEPYCAGAADNRGLCAMPRSEQSGTIKQTFDDDLVLELAHTAGMRMAKDGAGTTKPTALNFVTIGDNDASDCQHLDLALDVAATYVVP
jgi:hypothetical protein